MHAQKELSKGFWAEALLNAVYVRNRVCSRAISSEMILYYL